MHFGAVSYQISKSKILNVKDVTINCSVRVTALTLGRLPQILTNAITVELPPIDEEEDEKPWGPSSSSTNRRQGARAMTFRQCASLSKIVNSTLLMFFAPSQIIKGSLLLDEYTKYLNWYHKLPSNVLSDKDAPAHVLSLQYGLIF
jgi:hypothetical protein